jgi:hypothetical protein
MRTIAQPQTNSCDLQACEVLWHGQGGGCPRPFEHCARWQQQPEPASKLSGVHAAHVAAMSQAVTQYAQAQSHRVWLGERGCNVCFDIATGGLARWGRSREMVAHNGCCGGRWDASLLVSGLSESCSEQAPVPGVTILVMYRQLLLASVSRAGRLQ